LIVFGIEGLVFGMYYRVFDAKAMQLHFYYSIEQANVGTDYCTYINALRYLLALDIQQALSQRNDQLR
jgi:hypothetical protein